MLPTDRFSLRRAITLVTFLSSFASPYAKADPPIITLRHLDSTNMMIGLAWTAVPGATGYTLDRISPLSAAASYDFPPTVTVFGDSGYPPLDRRRLHTVPVLSSSTTYQYRVRARLPGGSESISNTLSARLADLTTVQAVEARRGVSGDLYADIVLGKPNFAEASLGRPIARKTEWAGGVFIDKQRTPNRVFIADTNHNRVLGFDHLGTCTAGISSTGNLALGRAYTLSHDPLHDGFKDPQRTKLTDGQVYGDSSIEGMRDISLGYAYVPSDPVSRRTVDVTIDLTGVSGQSIQVNTASLFTNKTIESIAVSTSTNGSSFTARGSATNPRREFQIITTFATVSARYVRFTITGAPADPTLDLTWMFITELRVGRMEPEAQAAVTAGTQCTNDTDCPGAAVCPIDPNLTPQVVLGQPALNQGSGCNRDATCRAYPNFAPASADSLCLIHPEIISIGETTSYSKVAVDAAGAVYVADLFNQRVLKYNDPFSTDNVADDVWGQRLSNGQPDFVTSQCNNGDGPSAPPSAEGLCFAVSGRPSGGTSVAFDSQGNLWVADRANFRILRFPKNPSTGQISYTANAVIGQPDFTTLNWPSAVAPVPFSPMDIAFGAGDKLYVSTSPIARGDGTNSPGRLLVFNPPYANRTQPNAELPLPHGDLIETTTLTGGVPAIWIQQEQYTSLYRLDNFQLVAGPIEINRALGVAVDSDGNMYAQSHWYELVRFAPWLFNQSARVQLDWRELVFPGGIELDQGWWGAVTGVAVAENTDPSKRQLLVSEYNGIQIYNNFSVDTITSGRSADALYAALGMAYLDIVDGKLWAFRQDNGYKVQQFALPLTPTSQPLRNITLRAGGFSGFPILGNPAGSPLTFALGDAVDYAVDDGGDSLWVADRWNSRVVRIVNLLGQRVSGQSPYVDVILGQPNATSNSCNRGLSAPTASTLCRSYYVSVDPIGDVWVTDNGGEAGANSRILQFPRSLFPQGPPASGAQAIYGPAARRVFGTGGSFTVRGESAPSGPVVSAFAHGFSSNGRLMVVPTNPYQSQRFPYVFVDPISGFDGSPEYGGMPMISVGDYHNYPGQALFDSDGNLYIADYNYRRLLIYRQPFPGLSSTAQPQAPSGLRVAP